MKIYYLDKVSFKNLGVLLFLAFIMKTILYTGEGSINIDAVRYIKAAQLISSGRYHESLSVERMPFYSYLISLIYNIIGDWELSALLLSTSAMVFSVFPLYHITREIFDDKAAFWAGLAFTTSPLLNKYSLEVLRDPLFILFSLMIVSILICILKFQRGWLYLFLCLFLLLAMLCRIEAVFWAPMIMVVVTSIASYDQKYRAVGLKGLFFLILISLSIIFITIKMDSAGGITLRMSDIGEYLSKIYNLSFLDNYNTIYNQMQSFEKTLPGWGGSSSFSETARHYIPLIYIIGLLESLVRNIYIIFALPIILCFVWTRRANLFYKILLFFVFGFLFIAYAFLFANNFISKRYVLLPAVLLMPWVGCGLKMMWSRVTTCRFPRAAAAVLLLIFCFVPAYASVERVVQGPDAVKVAGQWLSSMPALDMARIVTNDVRIMYYAEKEEGFQLLHSKIDFVGMQQKALEGNCDLLVIEASKSQGANMPEYEAFELIRQFSDEKNVVLIYRRRS